MNWKTAPKLWRHREPLTADKLNTEIRDRFLFLQRRPRSQAQIPPNPANIDLEDVGTEWQQAPLKGVIEASGGDIMFIPSIGVELSVLGAIYIDIKIDRAWFISRPASQATYGCWIATPEATAYDRRLCGVVFAQNIAPGRHEWEIWWKATAAGTRRMHNTATYGSYITMEAVEI